MQVAMRTRISPQSSTGHCIKPYACTGWTRNPPCRVTPQFGAACELGRPAEGPNQSVFPLICTKVAESGMEKVRGWKEALRGAQEGFILWLILLSVPNHSSLRRHRSSTPVVAVYP